MRWIGIVIALMSVLLAGAVVALAAGTALDAASNAYAMLSAMVWATWGPHFVVATVVALLLAMVARRMGARFSGGFAIVVSMAAILASGFIVFQIVIATNNAGGVINPVATLALATMREPAPDAVETIEIVDGRELKAAIYRPNGERPAPVFAYIHGGGFMAGTNTETAADLRWFADRGWLVISIDYRVFGPNYPTWDKAPADAACGLAWIGANAARLDGDVSRIALLGDSAGGNLAINIGYAAADGRAVSGCGGTVPVPKAIAVQYPAVDPVATYERGFPIPGFEPAMLMAGYVGGTPAEFPERIAAISSANFITPKAPPTLIIEPQKDSLVVSDGVYAFAEKAKAAGVDLELVRMPFANHIYNQIAANSLGNQAGRTIRLRFIEARVR